VASAFADPIMLGSMGSVLAGAIFGDHCSPISDTTILSSQSSGCDHLAHVWTQLPYAATVAGITILVGTLPVGLGVPVGILLPCGALALWAIVRLAGRQE
jgi:Na+/H+ antiporter NhaC